ncbi:DUF4148 domain-containing protein [Bordetella pseudohinzii]|uniref:DUF4148 domain-containing protein n=1 Tax=Bordetella pseudohinzii TaxID=1331258 RepID=A0A0J6BZN1_9BORD|nr:DUF4148 domain-containing protein [Bordetella pseudohinzii]ANY16986.1 hypothetical protein BBN53_14555 [Bordetella pseudohinzii]KMM24188.1 hypothetical protein L540_07940 [Bordetella pseudohinzii]KXA78295.1 hypothetical protein AW877_11825 [Bordetella pseudohinzii]KXA78431.1 hypothetical protein AW878_13095 [Bordetella pseudohinzii]CUJ11634.1 Uncharacterised protein [Bordetella pseudohinzii]
MKTLVSALMLSAVFVGAAQAGELDWPPAQDNPVTATRAQVQSDLRAARQAGLLASGEEDYPVTAYADAGQASRGQVKAELAAARAQGLTDSGELDYPPVAG